MELTWAWQGLVMGIVEGATEFLPVSSTGHLIVAGDLVGLTGERAKTFEIVIQLGAILAVAWIYRARFASVLASAGREPKSRQFLLNLLVAFVPFALVGLLTRKWIRAHLFSPLTVGAALVAGGIAMLLIERTRPAERITAADEVPLRDAGLVGLAQVLALFPGISRAGATIMGAYLLGFSRAAATEFSFFLSVPVLGAATAYEMLKAARDLGAADIPLFATGFVVSFVVALVVIRQFLRYVAHHSFRAFAWYRLAAGAVLLVAYWGRA